MAFTLRVKSVLGRSSCRIVWVGLLCLLAVALLSACDDGPTETPTPEPTPATSIPTPTSVPPTPTSVPPTPHADPGPDADPGPSANADPSADPDPNADAGAGWRSRDTWFRHRH